MTHRARGVKKVNEDLGLDGQIIETTSIAEQETAIRAALSGDNDLILALAPDPELCSRSPRRIRIRSSACRRTSLSNSLPDNIEAFQVNVHEGSYLVGIVAGMMTDTKTVGAVVGGNSPGSTSSSGPTNRAYSKPAPIATFW